MTQSMMKALLQQAALYVRRRPRFQRLVMGVLARFPGLKAKLVRAAMGGAAIYTRPAPQPHVPTELAHLTPRARQIHADLKAAIERHQKENG